MRRSSFKVMMKLIVLVKPLSGIMLLAILMGLLGHLAASLITIFSGYAVLNVLGFDSGMTMTVVFISISVFAIVRGLLRYAEQASNHYIAFRLLALIRDKVFSSLRRLAPAKLDGKDKGNLISIITSDIELLEVFYAHTISPVCIAILFSSLIVIFIGSFNIILAIIAVIAFVTIGGIIPLFINKLSGDLGSKQRRKAGELSSYVLESLRGLDETIQYEQGEDRLEHTYAKTQELLKIEEKLKRVAGMGSGITNVAIIFFDITMLLVGYYLSDFETAVICTLALMSSFGPVVSLSALGSTLQNTLASGNRVLDILEEEPIVKDISGKKEVVFTGAEAESVTFSYGNERILNDFSLDIPLSKIIGIVGVSGSGKSTLLKLFMRFWPVEKGSISLSDVSVDQINTDNLREMESFMTQETYLFHDSIKNNLLISKRNATDEELVSACKKASIHDYIMSLPKGYDTEVGELGDTLSGGERQRLGLVRAFLHDAPFMLLDEPTSNLDSLNEAVILRSLEKERGDKTIVIVSHRKSTTSIADKVYQVEQGRVS